MQENPKYKQEVPSNITKCMKMVVAFANGIGSNNQRVCTAYEEKWESGISWIIK
ncbi:MAG: hypothetical protein HY818_15025 [Acetobacterium woodii]|nr:hypothetical protein [Acetobacterium woodii]